jgi:hypothetical protein
MDVKNHSEIPSDSSTPNSNATINATTTHERQELTDDDMLLAVIEAWPGLSTARKRMIKKLVLP